MLIYINQVLFFSSKSDFLRRRRHADQVRGFEEGLFSPPCILPGADRQLTPPPIKHSVLLRVTTDLCDLWLQVLPVNCETKSMNVVQSDPS